MDNFYFLKARQHFKIFISTLCPVHEDLEQGIEIHGGMGAPLPETISDGRKKKNNCQKSRERELEASECWFWSLNITKN